MPQDDQFAELIRRARDGDPRAAQELIKKYEPAIRREARLRLGPRLRPQFDSMDLCQSVLGSFFVRIAAGQYEFDTPAQLMRLLITMTQNKVREKARKRHEPGFGSSEPVARDEDHANQVLDQDFLGEFRRRLTDEERLLWDRRSRDVPWERLASERGTTPEALRQMYSRAVRRVARELGLESTV